MVTSIELLNNVRKNLAKLISSEVLWDKEILDYYSVDSSSYRIKPKVIVFPKNQNDILKIIKFSRENKIPIVPRGASTGLVGGALGSGIILDLKNLNHIIVGKNFVSVGPGITKGKLDLILKKEESFFAPNPSIGPYCSVGGMIANNSSGSKSLKYGSVIDNLLEVTIITGNGEVITLPSNKKFGKAITNFAHAIDRKKYPNVTKNSCGYRLDAIKNLNDSHKIIAGSEGTLGIIVSAKLKTKKIPRQKCLLIIEYDDVIKATKECVNILRTKPTSLEFVDEHTLKNISHRFHPSTECLLFVEYDANLKKNTSELKKIILGRIVCELYDEFDIERWWRFRDLALSYNLKFIPKNMRIPHMIEDAAVPVEDLDKLITIINKINRRFDTKSIIYGHAGNGNLHIRLISKRKDKKLLKKIAKNFFIKVIKMGGTITAEHGDGLPRSEFIKLQYGNKNYKIFRELKKLFDPDNVLNPGKIITEESQIVRNLMQI